MRAVALALTLSLVSTGCFPENPRARTFAKLGEGVTLGAGIVLEGLINSGADCDLSMPGMPDSGCHTNASVLGNIGVVLILAGLIGFVATISTTPDEKPEMLEIKEIKAPKAPGVGSGSAPAPAPMPAAAPTPTPAPMPAAGSAS